MFEQRPKVLTFLATLFLWTADAHGQVTEEDDLEAMVAPVTISQQSRSADTVKAVELIVEQTNQFRKQENFEAVATNDDLTEASQYFADYMARTNKYGHTADGQRPAGRAAHYGYDYCIVLENIAYQYSSRGFATEELAERFVEGWKKSPGHRKNMLDADVTQTGVAVARSEASGRYYAVQMFGRPKSELIEFQVMNHSDELVEYFIGARSIPLPPNTTMKHQVCRPTKLSFALGSTSKTKEATMHPKPGDVLLVERNKDGELNVRLDAR